MDLKLLLTVFSTIFIAELGDKTQIATLLYASGSTNSKLTVFLGSACALITASGIAQYVNSKYLSWVAGFGFICVGIWTIIKA
ncbi:MAG: TMEM165/GDT1 family protein [Deltaproteobacteria bacterium]|nr:TMEM165/GDT1 family protein [Deltaproteobacteria bacterium]